MPLEAIADAVNKDESTACRIRTGEARLTVHEFCALVDAAGKKLVGKGQYCVNKAKFEAVILLLTSSLSDEETVRKTLRQDDE